MQVTLNFGRWTKLHSIAAIGLALVVGGIVGRAAAVSPITSAPVRWVGGVSPSPQEFTTGPVELFKVPAGSNFMLTDLIVGTLATTPASIRLGAGGSGCAGGTVARLQVVVPAGGTLAEPLATGIGFASGQSVCLTSNNEIIKFANVRGYLFTAAPPN